GRTAPRVLFLDRRLTRGIVDDGIGPRPLLNGGLAHDGTGTPIVVDGDHRVLHAFRAVLHDEHAVDHRVDGHVGVIADEDVHAACPARHLHDRAAWRAIGGDGDGAHVGEDDHDLGATGTDRAG